MEYVQNHLILIFNLPPQIKMTYLQLPMVHEVNQSAKVFLSHPSHLDRYTSLRFIGILAARVIKCWSIIPGLDW